MKLSKILLFTSLWITPLLSLAFLSSASPKFNYSFRCNQNPRNNVYSTQIIFSTNETIDMIFWKKSSNLNKTCSNVSSKFQEFKENRRLNYLLTGKSSTGQTIICGSAKQSESCNDSNRIFILLPGTNPQSTIEGLTETISGGNSPILQGSDDEIIVNFEDLIANIRQKQAKKPGTPIKNNSEILVR
jgi:Circadian oscillating protein COP23